MLVKVPLSQVRAGDRYWYRSDGSGLSYTKLRVSEAVTRDVLGASLNPADYAIVATKSGRLSYDRLDMEVWIVPMPEFVIGTTHWWISNDPAAPLTNDIGKAKKFPTREDAEAVRSSLSTILNCTNFSIQQVT